MHRFERRKQILASEDVVEVLPTIGIKRSRPVVLTHDSDGVHRRERWEVFERFDPIVKDFNVHFEK
jgi:hypothetical protein